MKRCRPLISAGLALLTCASSAGQEPLFARLRADHAVMVAAERDFHARRLGGDLGGTEAADYAAYVARLHRRVAEGCAALAEAGLPMPPEPTCPSLPPTAAVPAAIDQAGEQTVDEQIAELDARLSTDLAEFDEMLLREQERVRAAGPVGEASLGGAGNGGTGGAAAGSNGAGPVDGAQDAGDTQGTGPASGSGPRKRGEPSQPGRGAPPGVPDGTDDDLVARQLREAAEQERDPELRERLWEEYRRYKEGTRGGAR